MHTYRFPLDVRVHLNEALRPQTVLTAYEGVRARTMGHYSVRLGILLFAVVAVAGVSPASAQGQPGRTDSDGHAHETWPFSDATGTPRLGPDAPSLSPDTVDVRPGQGVGSPYADPTRAVVYSLGGTLALTPIFGIGLITGPSFGHFYAGNSEHAWRGIKIRTGCVLVPLAVWGAVSVDLLSFDRHEDLFLGTLGAGASILLWSAIYDILSASDSAREMNAARRSGPQFQITPTVRASRDRQVGVSIRVPF